MAFNDYQRFVLDNYEDGDFSYIRTNEELAECGDGLLEFLVSETSDGEDCVTWQDMVRRLQMALGQIESLLTAAGTF